MFARRQWIPPGGLLFAQACHGLSWLLLLWIALFAGIDGISTPALAWIHLVALGWFTIAALSILLHVVPGFTDLRWRFEGVARVSLGILAAGVAAFVLALLVLPRLADVTATWVFAALLVYAGVAWATLAQARRSERVERAIARALALTLAVLIAVALLGLVLSLFVSGTFVRAWMASIPAAHANLAFFGWLSLLIYGVSARTVRPICGAKSQVVWIHAAVASVTFGGALVLAAGLGFGNALATWIGAGLVGLGALGYVADIGSVLVRASVPHRPPQAFIAASLLWLLVAVACGGLSLAGRPFALAFGFVFLIGWVGQMVNAHMFHIGTRVIATVYRGDEDETPPQTLLDVTLEWSSFALFQTAIALAACGLALDAAMPVAAGAALGFAAWATMFVDFAIARARARSGPVSLL